MAALTSKQKRFCSEYLVDGNATRAAIKAGYSRATAASQGGRLLKNVQIKAYLSKRQQKVERKLEISAERTKLELARIAFQDARQFYREDGSLIPIPELSDDAAACLAGMEIEELFEQTRTGREQIGVLKKIKRYDKIQALNMLGKHFKIFDETPAPVVNINVNGLSAGELKALLAIKKKVTT